MQQVIDYLQLLQKNICHTLEEIDGGATFLRDQWQRDAGGGGLSCVMRDGKIFESAGVNFSHVHGDSLPKAATAKRPALAGRNFQAMGVSVVLHPQNPYVPTTHLNVRYFVANKPGCEPIWWFGGGYDLTPYYGFVEDCVHWHQTAKTACESFHPEFYPRFKRWADDYFYLPHRQETRGIGGIFFDDLNELPFADCFGFMQRVGDSFLLAYLPIVKRRNQMSYGERERQFQCYRRGRYVEFNLLYDRGTLFGLQSQGRTESILMSLPPVVNWQYNWQPATDSAEAELYANFLRPRDWLADVKV